MAPGLRLTLVLWAAWAAVTLGIYFVIAAVWPGTPPMVASLWIIGVVSVMVAAGVSWARWWQEIGYTRPSHAGVTPAGSPWDVYELACFDILEDATLNFQDESFPVR